MQIFEISLKEKTFENLPRLDSKTFQFVMSQTKKKTIFENNTFEIFEKVQTVKRFGLFLVVYKNLHKLCFSNLQYYNDIF